MTDLCQIPVSIKSPGVTVINICDYQGKQVRTVNNSFLSPGDHCFSWNGKDDHGNLLPGGLYFVRLTNDKVVEIGKIIKQ
jgi:flagellar hook assembly protein FlgD